MSKAFASQADLAEIRVLQQLMAKDAFFDLLAAQERLSHVQAMAQSAMQLAATAQKRLNAGDLSAQDFARVEIEAGFKQALETGLAFDFELPLVTAVGRAIWVRARRCRWRRAAILRCIARVIWQKCRRMEHDGCGHITTSARIWAWVASPRNRSWP